MIDIDTLKGFIDGMKKDKLVSHPKISYDVSLKSQQMADEILRGGFQETSKLGLPALLESLINPNDISNNEDQILSNLNIKYGIDPNKPEAHLGHMTLPFRLKELQDKGANVYLLLGTFTAQFGDPTDKGYDRERLSLSQTRENSIGVLNDIIPVLDKEKTHVVFNHEWYNQMSVESFDYLCSKFPMSSLMQRSLFKEREQLSGGALMYPLLQAFDSVILNSSIGAGGMDQKLNEMGGRDIQYNLGLDEQMVFLSPLIKGTDNDAKNKMSKSKGNTINFKDPLNTYGKLLESMLVYPDLIKDWGESFVDYNKIKSESSNDEDLAKNVAFAITGKYFNTNSDEDIATKAKELYDGINVTLANTSNELTSNLSIKDLDGLVNNIISKRNDHVHKFLDTLTIVSPDKYGVGDLQLDMEFGDPTLVDRLNQSDKQAVVYLDTSNDKLTLAQVNLFDELKSIQKEGYHIKILFGDYETGVIDSKSNISNAQSIENSNKLKKQIVMNNLVLVDDSITFINSSELYTSMKLNSLLEVYSQLNFKELSKNGMIKLESSNHIHANEHITRHTEGDNTLSFQKELRSALSMVMVGGSSDSKYLGGNENINQLIGYMGNKLNIDSDVVDNYGVGSNIHLDNENPHKFYSDLMKIPDSEIGKFNHLILCSEPLAHRPESSLSYISKLDDITAKVISGKMDVSRGITQRFFGAETAKLVEDEYSKKQLDLNIPSRDIVGGDYNLVDLIQEHMRPNDSKSNIRRIVGSGSVKINGEKIIDFDNPYHFNRGDSYELVAGKKNKLIFNIK